MSAGKAPKYDYYNPSTWLVVESEEEKSAKEARLAAEAAKTDDALALFERSIAETNGDYSDYGPNCDGIAMGETPSSPLRNKPIDDGILQQAPSISSPSSSVRKVHPEAYSGGKTLPHRTGGMKLFADEEYSSSESDGYDSDSDWNQQPGFPGVPSPPRARRIKGRDRLVQPKQLTIEEQREKLRKAKAKQARAKLLSMGEAVDIDHDVIVEKMMNVAAIPLPEPVKKVSALGKDGCAAVWWEYDREKIGVEEWVSAWEILRYRLDKDGQWRLKGTTVLNEHHSVFQNRVTVKQLENDAQYKFSVIGVNARGEGFESAHSNAVMVEAVLPPGWFRFWDEKALKFFYSNIKTQQSSWKRPELDPWYLDESVVLAFNTEEIEHLKELFIEETQHFTRITPVGFRRIMLEVGESMGMRKTLEYFQEYVGTESVTKWADFMFITSSMKKRNQFRDRDSKCTKIVNYSIGLPCFCFNECLSQKLTLYRLMTLTGSESYHEAQRIGRWKVEWHALAERFGYTNTQTGEHQWDTPEEVRFYLPKKMEEQLLETFNEGDLQDFRVRFAHLDVNNSGAIDEHEFKLLLESMDMRLSEKHRRKLIREIDINGNGTIEFHEFCFMMLTLRQAKDGLSNIWDKIKVISADADTLHGVSKGMVQATQREEEYGNRDVDSSTHVDKRLHYGHLAEAEMAESDEMDPTSIEYQRQLVYQQRQMELAKKVDDFENQTFNELLASEEEAAKGPIKKQKFSAYTADIASIERQEMLTAAVQQELNLTNNAKSVLEKAGVHMHTAADLVRAGDSKEDRAYAKQLLRRDIEAGRVVVQDKSASEFSSLSRFAQLLRPLNPDEQKKKNPYRKERKPFTGESYVDRITRKRAERAAAEEAARAPTCLQSIRNVLFSSSIGVLYHLGKCIINCRQGTSDFIDAADEWIDFVSCARKPGIHGKHCMCGCRFMYPEDVNYPFWTKDKSEPLSWALVCPYVPCCDD